MPSPPLPHSLLKSLIPVTMYVSSLSCRSLSRFVRDMNAPSSVCGKTLCRAAGNKNKCRPKKIKISITWGTGGDPLELFFMTVTNAVELEAQCYHFLQLFACIYSGLCFQILPVASLTTPISVGDPSPDRSKTQETIFL